MLAAIFLTLLVKLQTRSWFITESLWWYHKLQFFSKQQPEYESLAPSRDIKTQCSVLRLPILCNVCCRHFHFISIFCFTGNPAMNAVPDLRLILFKELQAILHVATATAGPGLQHFETYWTVLPCEAIHRHRKGCSLSSEILLFPPPGAPLRDAAETPSCLHHPSVPIFVPAVIKIPFFPKPQQQLHWGRASRTSKGEGEPDSCFPE